MQITYKDKVTLQNNPNIPDENKVTAEDMNEIKSVVNSNEEEQQALNMSAQEIAQNVANNSQEISNIKEEQTTQNENIRSNSNDISDLRSNKADKNEIPTDLSQLSNANTKFVDETGLENAILQEKTQRQNSDNSLQNQIDAITASTDVIDIVGTYQDLQNYDISKVKQNDVIKVLQDSTHSNAMSYYRWQSQWIYVGSEGPYYTIGQTDELLQGKANQRDLDQTNTNVTNLAGRVLNNESKIKNIEQEQTEQNINITKNATNIETLQSENENLKSIVAQLPQVEGEGPEVTLEDTIEAPFTKFDVEGHSEQGTTEGRNLLEYYNLTERTSNGIKFTPIFKDGLLQYINVNGTATGQADYFISNGYSTENILKGDYTNNDTLKILGTGTSDIKIYANKASILYGEKLKDISNAIDNPLKWFLYRIESGVVINNVKVYPFVYNYTKLGDVDYEPYTNGASPSPNWEQPILSSGDNVNLFDLDNIANVGPVTASLTKLDKDTFRLTTLSTGNNQANIFRALDLTNYAGKYFTIQAFVKSSSTNPAQIILRQNNYDYSGTKSNEVYSDSKITTDGIIEYQYKVADTITDANRYLFIVGFATRNMACEIGDYVNYKIKIEPGSTATPWSPYGIGSINDKIISKNFLEITENNMLVHCSYVSGANTNEYKLLCTTADMYVNEVQSTGTTYNKTRNGNLIPCKYGETIYFDNGNSLFNKNFINEFDENFISLGSYNRQMVSGTYTPTNSNCKYITFRFGYGANAVPGTTYTLAPIVSKTPIDSYVPHKEQTYSIHTQQPFRSIEDVFFKNTVDSPYYDENLVENGWYERHPIPRLILTGDEEWNILPTSLFQLPNIPVSIARSGGLCNRYRYNSSQSNLNNTLRYGEFAIQVLANGTYLYFKNTDFTDIESFKADLKAKYEAGTPVYVDYILAEPLDLPCTEEQIEILENPPKTYAGQTNIYSEDEVEALVKAKGIYDMNKLITRVEVLESQS